MSLLWHEDNYTEIVQKPLDTITTGTEDKGNGVYLLRAGTPISSLGAVANSSSAKYIVAEDFYFYGNKPDGNKIVNLVAKGYVDLKKAEAAYGSAYKSAAKTALKSAGVVLVDGKLSADNTDTPTYTLPAATTDALGGVKMAVAQTDSTAEDVAGLLTDFNALLAKLRTAGIIDT